MDQQLATSHSTSSSACTKLYEDFGARTPHVSIERRTEVMSADLRDGVALAPLSQRRLQPASKLAASANATISRHEPEPTNRDACVRVGASSILPPRAPYK